MRPLSKTQGGNWWIIRRANGSVVHGVLERTRKVAIYIFVDGDLEYWKKCVKQGYSAERVTICTARPHGRGHGEGCPMRMKKDKP